MSARFGTCLAGPAAPFDQIEHRRAEHVHVFEHQDDLSSRPETLDQRQEPALHVLDEDRLLALGGAEPDREAELPGDPLRLARVAAAVHDVLQPAHRLVRRHVVLDAGDLADDRRHGRERGGVAVGLRPSAEDGDVLVESGEELIGEPGLADPGFPQDRHEERARRGLHPRHAPSQDVHLVGTTHERDRAPGRPRGELLHLIGRERAGEPLRLDLLLGAEGDGVLRQRVRGRPDEHLARLRRRLEAGRGVDHLTGDEELPGGSDARRRLSRLDADPDLQGLLEPEGLLEPVHPVADREPGPHGPHRVVLLHLREPEDRHHGVADELLRMATERAELLARGVEESPEDLASAFRVEPLREAGGVDEVGEHDRDHLPLLGPERGGHGRAAVRAEAGSLRQGVAAELTPHGAQHRGGHRPGRGRDGRLERHGSDNVRTS